MFNFSVVNSLLTVLLIILIVVFGAAMYFLASNYYKLKGEVDSIKAKISDSKIEKSLKESANSYHANYVELTQKADAQMGRLVSIVGVIATVYTVFGALVVFQAPREIDNRMNKMELYISEAKDSAIETKYLSEINDALINNYGEAPTNSSKLNKLSKVIKKYPDKPRAYMEKGLIYFSMKKNEEAIKEYERALEKGGDKAWCYNCIGTAYHNLHEYEKAIDFFDKAIELSSEYATAYYNRGNTYRDKGDNDKAIEDYDKAIELNESDADAYFNRGNAFYDKDDYDKAIDDYTKAISLNSGLWEAYQGRGLAYKNLMEKEKDQAKKEELRKLMEADFKKAEELKPKGE